MHQFGLTNPIDIHEYDKKQPDVETKQFKFIQTMYRVKDPKLSVPFYTKVLGMTLLHTMEFTNDKFTIYFLGYEDSVDIPKEYDERTQWVIRRPATIEFTYNWGTENDPNFRYHHGNTEPRGFGHIGVMVPDVHEACERFEQLNVKFVKRPDEGRMRHLAFIQDPDGYWIEIFDSKCV